MQNNLALLALAAGLGQVNANPFMDASPFSCPGNTDNHCTPDMSKGFDWQGLGVGSFTGFGGFDFSGFTCEDSFSKRDPLLARSDFQSKCITGRASQDTNNCPSIKCGKDIDKSSISHFQVTPDHDCDLEFHYSMPDGSTCKHRSSCKSSGTVVTNSQCGGATGVTVVYPHQPNTGKDSCSVGIHSMGFDCEGPSPTVSHSYPAQTYPATSSSSIPATTSNIPSSYPVFTPPSSSSSVPATTPESSSTPASSYVASSSSASVPAPPASYSVVPGSSSSSSVAASSSSSSVAASSTPGSSYVASSTTSSAAASSTPGYSVVPSSSVSSSVAVSTSSSVAASSSSSVPVASSSPAVPTSYAVSSTTISSPVTTTSGSSYPTETLPCPGVVPSCLNTWMFSVGCKDNTDSSCYCPDSSYIKNVYDCLYAHGESDDEVSEAIQYLQGLCAPYVTSNPGIATAPATITSYLTVTSSISIASPTVITVSATQVVPCTDSVGLTIPGSSSTVTVTTAMTVPQVVFTTVTAATTPGAASTPAVVIVPGSYVVATPTPTGGAPYPTGTGVSTFTTSASAGFTPTTPTGAIPTGGAAHVGSGLSIMGMVAFAFVAL